MKVKSIKRLPYKILLFFPFARKILMWVFNRGGDRLKNHLYDMVSTKPPIWLHKDEMYYIDTWGGKYLFPVRKELYREDWSLLFSIGHDIEVKAAYRELINSASVSKFIDIGSNYGLHSMIFESHGIPSVVVEPNSECLDRVRWLSSINKFDPLVYGIALSDSTGKMFLSWPHGKTWLGEVINQDESSDDKKLSECVKVDTLDNIGVLDDSDCLVKIDVEGHELEVLRGGVESIKRWRPYIIFESLPDKDERGRLYDFFADIHYSVKELTCMELQELAGLSKDNFVDNSCRNFIGFPRVS